MESPDETVATPHSSDRLPSDHLGTPSFSNYFERSPSPTSSVRGLHVRSRPTSQDFSLDGLPFQSSTMGFSIGAALELLHGVELISPSVPAKGLDYSGSSRTVDDCAHSVIAPSSCSQSTKYRAVRIARLDANENTPSVPPNNQATPMTHRRARTWSFKRIGLTILNRKGFEGQLPHGGKTPNHPARKSSISGRLGFLPFRRVGSKGVEHIATDIGGAPLRRARSLAGLRNNLSLINGLEADGIDEATADAVRHVAMMNEEYDFEEIDSDDDQEYFNGRSDSKSAFDARR